jgi:hypothetical protein
MRVFSLRGFWVLCLFATQAWGVIQLASGTPEENPDTAVVRVPLYFYTDEAITAGQFDVSIPDGWTVLAVDGAAALGGIHSIEADSLDGGGVRVVVFSLNNSAVPVGSLGNVVMRPPSVGEIADLTFSNPLFVSAGGSTISITPGFPALRILSQPLNQTVLSGQTALLSVSALAIDPTFAWFAGTSGDTSSPVGGSSPLYRTPALSENASYWVRITDTFGEVIDSATATVLVDTGPTFIFNPNSRAVGWREGSGAANLLTPAGVAWTASSSADWLIVGTAAGTGPGPVAYRYEANLSGSPRSAQLSVGGVTFTVNQEARPSIFADYAKAAGSEWRWVPWFGFVTDNHYPWVYHRNHGWLYIVPTLDPNSFFAYNVEGDLGWLYTSSAFYNASTRWVYSFRYESYLFFYPIDSLNPASRLFYEAENERWFSFPEE